jgi:hypothetical protein
MPRTKVFLTWSGKRSKEVAIALRKWLPNVIQSLDPWMSESDIDKGTRWNSEISGQSEQAKIGIICLTPENLTEPWVNFEAGALSKLNGSYVCTYLLGLSAQDIPYPLAQFQATRADKEDTKKLLQSINKSQDGDGLPPEQLDQVFEKWWTDLHEAFSKIPKSPSVATAQKRTSEEVLEELVSTIRETSHTQTTILTAVEQISSALQEERQNRQPLINRNSFAEALNNLRVQSNTAPSFGFGTSSTDKSAQIFRRPMRRLVRPASKAPGESEGSEPGKKA